MPRGAFLPGVSPLPGGPPQEETAETLETLALLFPLHLTPQTMPQASGSQLYLEAGVGECLGFLRPLPLPLFAGIDFLRDLMPHPLQEGEVARQVIECPLTWPLVTCGLSEPGRHSEGFSWVTQRGASFCVFLGESHLGQVSLELPGEPEEEASEVGLEAPRPVGGSEPGILRAPPRPEQHSRWFRFFSPGTAS
uniref:Uncharacterized protein n=1 Tax=Myotis myotis TaxID=51298 RepID=A0A7J7VZ46_MYOMY|nr:hypothetical protein mMyoMyo1_012379 [Myotis myotis]